MSVEIHRHEPASQREARWAVLGSRGTTMWLTGLSGSGKSTIAHEVARRLLEIGVPAYVLDGDDMRHGLTMDLGLTPEDRAENARRITEVALLFADAGIVVICAVISPTRVIRDASRARHVAASLDFLEVYVDTALEVCEARDSKGLYARSRAGTLTGLSGVDATYEAPVSPDVVVHADVDPIDACADAVLAALAIRWAG